ncbi:MAG: hypothetical protein AMXMBFR8_26830 [Nevskiales bacterium]
MAGQTRRRGRNARAAPNGKAPGAEQLFAGLPEAVVESVAFRSVPDFAIRVLVVLALLLWTDERGGNGRIGLTQKAALERGLAPWKLAAGVRLLEEVGLIECTRRGRISAGRGICSLYAVAWADIVPDPRYDQAPDGRRAPHGYRQWVPPPNWPEIVKAIKARAMGRRKAPLTQPARRALEKSSLSARVEQKTTARVERRGEKQPHVRTDGSINTCMKPSEISDASPADTDRKEIALAALRARGISDDDIDAAARRGRHLNLTPPQRRTP